MHNGRRRAFRPKKPMLSGWLGPGCRTFHVCMVCGVCSDHASDIDSATTMRSTFRMLRIINGVYSYFHGYLTLLALL
jgi:hypothetical protein